MDILRNYKMTPDHVTQMYIFTWNSHTSTKYSGILGIDIRRIKNIRRYVYDYIKSTVPHISLKDILELFGMCDIPDWTISTEVTFLDKFFIMYTDDINFEPGMKITLIIG